MPDKPITPEPLVFLVHGIAAGPWMMTTLAQRLKAEGYRVRNWGYASVLNCIEHHGQSLAVELERAGEDDSVSEIYIVAHSMGAIVARHALSQAHPAKLRRAVFLGPPHRGSPW